MKPHPVEARSKASERNPAQVLTPAAHHPGHRLHQQHPSRPDLLPNALGTQDVAGQRHVARMSWSRISKSCIQAEQAHEASRQEPRKGSVLACAPRARLERYRSSPGAQSCLTSKPTHPMSSYVSNLFTLALDPKDFLAFEALVSEIVAATQKEPGTLIYEYSINADRTEAHILERYRA
ncbi:MAG: hypothetical protein EOP12_05220, partial [Pseudomonas sp.]